MDANGPHSVYFAACHGHPEHEAQIDVVLGTWSSDDASDHFTFSLNRVTALAVVEDLEILEDRVGQFDARPPACPGRRSGIRSVGSSPAKDVE